MGVCVHAVDSFPFDLSVFKRFVLRICFVTQFSKDSIWGFNLWCGFHKIWWILMNPANPHESLVHRRTLDKQILNFLIPESVCSSKDSFCRFISWCGSQKICFVHSIRDAVFKRFDLRIHFAKKNSKITQFVLIRKDSYTIPASLIFLLLIEKGYFIII